jgi:hypothetical protein
VDDQPIGLHLYIGKETGDMSYLGKMLSKTYLLKVNDVRVLTILKDLRERGR